MSGLDTFLPAMVVGALCGMPGITTGLFPKSNLEKRTGPAELLPPLGPSAPCVPAAPEQATRQSVSPRTLSCVRETAKCERTGSVGSGLGVAGCVGTRPHDAPG